MDNQFEPLATGEVLSVDESVQFLIGHSTFRSSEFIEAIKKQLLEYNIGGLTEDKEAWFSEEGIECEVLRFGAGGWQRGSVRINLEFCPSDPNSTKKPSVTKSQSQPATAKPQTVTEVSQPAAVDDWEEDEEPALETLTVISNQEDSDVFDTEEDIDLDLGNGINPDSEINNLVEEEPNLDFDESELAAEDDLDLGDSFGAESEMSFSDEDLDLGDSFDTEETDEDLDLGDSFGAESEMSFSDEDLDLGDSFDTEETNEDLDLGDSFGAESEMSFSDDDLDLGDSFGTEETEISITEEVVALGDVFVQETEIEVSTTETNLFSNDLDEDLGFSDLSEEAVFDLGDTFESKGEGFDFEELGTDDDFSLEDFSFEDDSEGNGDSPFNDAWQDQNS